MVQKDKSTNKNIQKPTKDSGANDLAEILRLLEKDNFSDEDLKKIAIKVSSETTTTISGPIPDPFTFGLYDKIVPGSAKEILGEFKKQSEHRRKLENLVIPSQNKQSERGQLYSFILAILALLGVLTFGYLGEKTISVVCGLIVLTLTGTFFVGKGKINKSIKEKEPKS